MIAEIVQNNPRISIVILSFFVTLFITIVSYYLTDKEKMKEIKQRQKDLKLEMKKHKDNPEKMVELNQKLLEDLPEQMKQSFKPMLITFIPIIIIFKWLWATYEITPLAVKFWIFPVWLWWYIGSSIVFSIVIRKIFGLQ